MGRKYRASKKPTVAAAAPTAPPAPQAQAPVAPQAPKKEEVVQEEEEEGWQLMTRSGGRRRLPAFAPTVAAAPATLDTIIVVADNDHEDEEEPPRLLFRLHWPTEAAFLIGAKGRNVALIRKHTGFSVRIQGMDVWLTTTTTAGGDAADRDERRLLACRMALSACTGGVLRWFVTPQSTRDGFSDAARPLLERTAAAYRCDVRALRSHKGHVCVLLLPQLASLLDVDAFRYNHLPGAREAMLAVMPPPPTATATPSLLPATMPPLVYY